ncbi:MULTISPECIES: hypothetical protein [unclassified Microcoleus]|uniref:hypothetical protein n=1 Tax=unclassified Microcoleus TaxID=2642155 RepID=UPI001DB79831|nr:MULTISPECIES: hypothetical protein [unclassified Microcoleus]TAF91620.1 MAG: hypothetical protein EAZ49_05260 [Oscillatoriales cyanobacterium]MCC3411936.1 hypothetical protein [Microcoleus sp. PH2017_02_FOX_O_A]MCC3447533.1 hypothetical protein [Microcoleus sp. PH2017_09_SFU_O_A]MCC3518310.1 hypothetical protein [Microcoleus sp. PH2017_18_LLB_O_A]MCC3628512.1 hypothetical protein [Microcoleus sp. PH2017_39_LGB_O_B]
MSDKISAPNVYLYAFQLHDDSQGRHNPLWKHCDNILANFTDKKLTPNLVFPPNSHSYREDLLPNVALKFNSNQPIEGFAQPLQIQDSYALCLNIGCPEDGTANNLGVDFIQKFNPNRVLLINGDDNFLGQTLLITTGLPENSSDNLDSLKPLADECRNALFQGDSPPVFYRSGKLFGSPIFEYGSIADIANYRHLLVWLLADKQTDKDFNTCQEEIFDLLFYRNKIIKVFQDSRLIYRELDREYRIIEKNVEILQAQFSRGTVLTAAQLQEFQEQLKQLFSKAVTYTCLLRKLEDYDNTIVLNLNNYIDILQTICDIIGIDKEELSILNHFSRKSALYMRSQIAGDLGYFRHGTNLIDQAIASIRGIVEIEQARSDRTNQLALRNSEDKEKDRDDRLESTVQAIGVGLAAGGIAASSGTDKLFETVQNHHIPVVMHLHPFAFSFLLSCAIALFAAGITWWRTKPKK